MLSNVRCLIFSISLVLFASAISSDSLSNEMDSFSEEDRLYIELGKKWIEAMDSNDSEKFCKVLTSEEFGKALSQTIDRKQLAKEMVLAVHAQKYGDLILFYIAAFFLSILAAAIAFLSAKKIWWKISKISFLLCILAFFTFILLHDAWVERESKQPEMSILNKGN